MAKKGNILEQIGGVLEIMWKAIMVASRWTWDYITIVVCILLFVNVFILFPVNIVSAVINLIVLVIFAFRVWKEYREPGE
jgi:hypothetical protein